MRRLWLVLPLALLTGACNGNPNDPSNFAQIADEWSGTFESNYLPEAIFVQLTQTTGSVTGTWAMSSGVRAFGNIQGTVDRNTFTGIITYGYSGGPTCQGSFSGNAGGVSMTWTSPGFTGNCGLAGANPTSVRFVLQRR